MRLWHYQIIQFLPRSQLLAQWRELNSIFKKQDNHILINYVYDYPKQNLWFYSKTIVDEMYKRGYKINSMSNYKQYFNGVPFYDENMKNPFREHHNQEYLTICYYNLKEKYIRGQKDFDMTTWIRLDSFYKKQLKGNKNG